jgi:predicted transcriptional regulator
MTEVIENLTTSFAQANNLDFDTASKLITWLEKDGVIDYTEVKNVYGN